LFVDVFKFILRAVLIHGGRFYVPQPSHFNKKIIFNKKVISVFFNKKVISDVTLEIIFLLLKFPFLLKSDGCGWKKSPTNHFPILKSCVLSIDIIFMYKNYIIFKVACQSNLFIFPILKQIDSYVFLLSRKIYLVQMQQFQLKSSKKRCALAFIQQATTIRHKVKMCVRHIGKMKTPTHTTGDNKNSLEFITNKQEPSSQAY
jgi:hypothetical protein